MDISKALEAEEGFLVEDGPFYTGGTASPIGLDLPTNTLYLQDTASGVLIFRKFGAGVNDWRQLSAQDVPFDVSGLTASSPDLTGLTQTQEVGEALAARVFGQSFAWTNQNPAFQTTSATFVPALTLSLGTVPAGTYFLMWSYRANNSKANTTNETNVTVNGSILSQGSQIGQDTIIAGGNGPVFSGFYSFAIPAGTLTANINARLSTGNGTVRISSMQLACWRVV